MVAFPKASAYIEGARPERGHWMRYARVTCIALTALWLLMPVSPFWLSSLVEYATGYSIPFHEIIILISPAPQLILIAVLSWPYRKSIARSVKFIIRASKTKRTILLPREAEAFRALIQDIRGRADRAWRQAHVALLGVFFLTSTAVAAIIFAGALTRYDIKNSSAIADAKANTQEKANTLAEIDAQINKSYSRLVGTPYSTPGIGYISTLSKISSEDALKEHRKIAEKALIDAIEIEKEAIRIEHESNKINHQDGISDINLLIAANGTRIAIVAIIFFFINILIGIYRYNMRMCAFYESLADAITVSGSSKNIENFMRNMWPNGIDFGKLPTSPLADIKSAFGGLKRKPPEADK